MSLWPDKHAHTISMDNFRAPDQYLSQPEDYPWEELARYCYSRDRCVHMGQEDGAFGCVTREVWGHNRRHVVSRDSLDSVVELDFLAQHRALAPAWEVMENQTRVLDIGSGYGRFAHRFLEFYPRALVYCADPIEISRQVCAKYLKHRGIPGEGLVGQPLAIVVDPRKLAEVGPVDLAVNIHCWPECSREEIRWWLDWLKERRVPRLFVIPHDPTFRCNEDGEPFLPDIEAAGYRMRTQWIGPECWPRTMALFHLEGT